MPRIVNKAPDPKSHVKTLMRIGYNLNSAIADIIDNSIAAEAKNIEVYVPPGRDDPFISILDNGKGMDLDELIDNMQIGCKDPEEEREAGDLGRFGSGMKTASFSQALRLTVVTKKKGHPLVAARWDIEKIQETNSWCLEVFEGKELELIDALSPDFPDESGTQIIWEKLTCIDTGSHSLGQDEALASLLAELSGYLALHFHRFIGGGKDKRNFFINNSLIEPVDPFMEGVKGYQEGPSEKLRCKGGHIEIKTHVLPHFNKMSPEQLEKLGGTEGIAQKQGIYIYREKRLIQSGGWMGMARNSQLGALARVQVDIPSVLDNDWSTDVKKASLQIPPRVKRGLKKFLADPVKRSKRVYRYRGTMDSANGYWKICENENTKVITYQIEPHNKLLEELLESCTSKQSQVILNYLKELSVHLPIHHIYEKMSERPKDIHQEDVDINLLEELLDKVFVN